MPSLPTPQSSGPLPWPVLRPYTILALALALAGVSASKCLVPRKSAGPQELTCRDLGLRSSGGGAQWRTRFGAVFGRLPVARWPLAVSAICTQIANGILFNGTQVWQVLHVWAEALLCRCLVCLLCVKYPPPCTPLVPCSGHGGGGQLEVTHTPVGLARGGRGLGGDSSWGAGHGRASRRPAVERLGEGRRPLVGACERQARVFLGGALRCLTCSKGLYNTTAVF
jgi:hypothetical protein